MTRTEVALTTAIGSLLWAVAGLVLVSIALGMLAWNLHERVDELESWRDRRSVAPVFIPSPGGRGR